MDPDSSQAAAAAPLQGTQDLLFESAQRLRRCELALAAVFERAGFHEVIPPSIEAADVFGPEAFRALGRDGRLVGLRSDFTAQVARIAATRLAQRSTLRLWYRGSVVRRSGGENGALHESLQAGCELVGATEPDADAEVLRLAAAALQSLGLGTRARLSLGSMAYFDAVVEAAGAPPALARALGQAIDRKDLPGLRGLCARELPSGRAADALLMLAEPPRPRAQAGELLARAGSLAPSPAATAALQRLSATLEACAGLDVEIDLGEVRGFGYYTGLVFNLYAEGAARAVGGGGRYDGLLGRFGDPRPAIGFSLDLDALVPLAVVAC